MLRSLGQLPQQPGIHGSEQQLPFFRTRLSTLHMIQYPANLTGREIRIQKQTGFFANHPLQPLLLQLLAIGVRLTGLPDDDEIYRLTALLIPDNCRLSLIGDADGSHLGIPYTGFGQHLKHHTDGTCPYIVCVLFHPARMRIIIFQLLLRYSDDVAGFIKQNGAGTGRSLINRHNIGCHISFLLRYFLSLYHRMIAVYTGFQGLCSPFFNFMNKEALWIHQPIPTAAFAITGLLSLFLTGMYPTAYNPVICFPVESFPSDYRASSPAVPGACS